MKHTNKAISLLLTLCMALSLAPWAAMPARAEDEPADWNETGRLPSAAGSYKLQTDVDLNLSTWYVRKTVTLDLNGHVIKNSNDLCVIRVVANGNLTLRDSRPEATHDTPVIYTDPLDPEKTVTVNGGVITGETTDTKSCRGVYVNGGAFTMEGGTITGSSAIKNSGGGVYVDSGAFTMKGGTIAGNSTNESGGGVYVYNGTFAMEKGTITGNAAKGESDEHGGGGVYVGGGGTFTMTDGTIKGNTAAKNGGGVYVRGGTFTMENGVISGNTAKCEGGGVSIVSSGSRFEMNRGTISGNRSGYRGGGVYAGISSTFAMSGGTITGNSTGIYYNGGGVYISEYSSTFKLSGGARIRNNWKNGSWDANNEIYVKGDGTAENVYLNNKVIIVAGELTNTASIGVTLCWDYGSGAFTSGLAEKGGEDAIKRFVSDDADYGVAADGNGEAKLDTNTPWKRLLTQLDEIETSGTIKLTEDCEQGTNDGYFTVPEGKEVTLDLAGYTLTGKGGSSVIVVAGTLNLTDSSDNKHTTEYDGSGTITGGSSAEENGGGVCVDGGKFTMTGGTISGNTAYNGGGVYVGEGGVFEMENGVISGNTANNEGGGMHVFGGTFTMNGGTVRGNLANGYCGGGVSVAGYGKLTMTGGEVTGNSVGKSTGGGSAVGAGVWFGGSMFELSGGARITENWLYGKWNGDRGVYVKNQQYPAGNLYLYDQIITVTGELTSTARIGVTATVYDDGPVLSNVAFTEDLTAKGGEGAIDCFESDVARYGVVEDENGEAKLERQYTEWEKLQAKLDETGASGKLVLDMDYTQDEIDEPLYVSSKTLTLDLAGHTLTGCGKNEIIRVKDDGELTLTDSSTDKTGKITGGNIGVYVDGAFTMEGGAIQNCVGYCGVYVLHGTFRMNGGEINNNRTEVGAVRLELFHDKTPDAAFEVSGGARVTGNTDKEGKKPLNVVLYSVDLEDEGEEIHLRSFITIAGKLENAKLGVSLMKVEFTDPKDTDFSLSPMTGVIARAKDGVTLADAELGCFESDAEGYAAGLNSDGVYFGRALTARMVSDAAAQTYTGEALTPAVTVTDGETTLTKDTDYTVSYENNVNAGTATLTVTGMGSYAGKVEKQFTIRPAEVTITALDAGKAFGEKDVDPVVKIVGVPAKGTGVNYVVSREAGEDPGKYAITVTANEKDNPNYSITTVGATFTITGVIGEWSADKLMARVCAPTGSLLVAAAYNDGKLELVKTVEISENKSLYDTGLTEEEGRIYKLMVVNGSNFAPLYDTWDSACMPVAEAVEPK